LIGVISREDEIDAVKEFFELFKTPWKFYKDGEPYEVVLSTRSAPENIKSKLLVIYGSDEKKFDEENSIVHRYQRRNQVIENSSEEFPVFSSISVFDGRGQPVLKLKETGDTVGLAILRGSQKVVRVGFNLFEEISFLLSRGQPVSFSHILTIEIHISMLRLWILQSGIPLAEIPPVPNGYNFITCLTHDVDFVGIRNHFFDHTMFGFLYRALFGTLVDVLRRRAPFRKLVKNVKAAASLPFIYLGPGRDFWYQFERYMKIEKGLTSTFFVIPFKRKAGEGFLEDGPKKRECKYDISDISSDIDYLVSKGHEVGLHGINAWISEKHARRELDRVRSSIGNASIGVRMHWLYFGENSFNHLDKAGFLYDSTYGYNDAVGYRAGTSQVFKPFIAQKMLELPLHIQDTALFYRGRMGLSETEAFGLIQQLLRNAKRYGGVLVINWHHRSIGPERYWDDFYIKLLGEIKKHQAWFATARDVVNWFAKRRSVTFEKVEFLGNSLKLKVSGDIPSEGPGLLLRIYRLEDSSISCRPELGNLMDYLDFSLREEMYLENI